MIENNNCEFNSNYPKRIFEVILEKSHNKEESNYFFNTDPKISPKDAPEVLDPYLDKASFSSLISSSLI